MTSASAVLARATLLVGLAFLGSRVLGWVRVAVMAELYGAEADLDAYFAAFRVPDLIYQLVAAGAVASAVVPVLTGLLSSGEPGRAWRVASTVINLMLLGLFGLSVVFAAFAPAIMPVLVPGFDAPTTELTVHLTRIMLLSPIFLALGAVASAVLNSQGRFAAAAVAPVMYNVCIIAAAVALTPFMGIDALAVGVVAGSFVHLLVQLPALRRRFDYHLGIDLRDAMARRTLALMGPRALGLGASQVTFAVNTTLATGLGVGAVVAYNVAFTVLQIPLGVVGFPLGVVLLPSLSRALAAGSRDDFAALLGQTLRLLLWATLFLAAVGIVLRTPTVELLFGGGFDQSSLALTARTLMVFLVGLPAHALNVVLARAFYSAQNTRTPVAVALLSVVVNVVVSIATVGTLGLSGLALGIALGGWTEAVVLVLLLHRRGTGVAFRPIARGAVLSLGGALVAAAGAAVVLLVLGAVPGQGRLAALVQLVLAGGAAMAAFLLYSRLMGLPELPRTLGLLRSALRRG